MTEENIIPEAPEITPEQLEQSRKSGDFSPVLFEWYKFVGRLCIFYASFRADSPAVRPMPELHYGVLVGLLTRCARLMFSNVVLSHEGLFGETTAILDRCIFDSSVKISWLCTQANKKSFDRFIADGLKSELVFKNKINEIISERGGHVLEIEKRMLTSIENYVATSKLTEIQIESAKKLPDLATMIKDINHDRLL